MSFAATLSSFEFSVMHYFCLKRWVAGDSVGLKGWNKNFGKTLLYSVINWVSVF